MTSAAAGATLLSTGDPAPFTVTRGYGRSPFVLVCDHAGRQIPRALSNLGLDDEALATHIAWDLGAGAMARHLSALLDAVLIEQTYSRLVIDCNRPLTAVDSIAEVSARVTIPGNRSLSPLDRQARVNALFTPYHDRIREELDQRARGRVRPVLVSVHSFTPQLNDQVRPWHAGVLYRDPTLARPLLAHLRSDPGLVVGDNEPYAVSDATDFTVVEHGERRGLRHVELEVRQDLLADEAGQDEWAARLARSLLAVF